MKFNIFAKLFYSFLAMTLFCCAFGLIALNDNRRIVQLFTAGDEHFRDIVTALTEIGSYTKRAEGHLLMYMSLHDAADKNKFFERCASLQQQLEILRKNVADREAISKTAKLKQLIDEVLPAGKFLIDAHDRDIAGTSKCEMEKYREPIKKLFASTSAIRENSVSMAKYELKIEEDRKLAAASHARYLQNNLIALLLLSFFAAFAFSYHISRVIARPLIELKNMARTIGEGSLEIRTSIQTADEIGDLAEALNRMADKLLASTRKVQESERLLAEITSQMPGIVFQFYARPDGKMGLYYINNKSEQIVGLKPDPDGYVERLTGLIIPEHRDGFLKSIEKAVNESSVWKYEGMLQKPSGEKIWVSGSSIPSRRENEIVFNGILQDITERKIVEEKINSLLVEKELLLKEVHHRIKNNMNTVTGLMFMQLETLKDPQAVKALEDARNRVISMMVLYDKLYLSYDFREISFAEYLSPLVDEIVSNFPNREIVKIEKNIDDFKLSSKMMSSLGIIINEILTNIMKHAFTDRANGLITICVTKKEKLVTVSIADDGIGIPDSIDITASGSFGLQLLDIMTQQLSGKLKIERVNGTKFILEFKA